MSTNVGTPRHRPVLYIVESTPSFGRWLYERFEQSHDVVVISEAIVACSIAAASMSDFSHAITKISLSSRYGQYDRLRLKVSKRLQTSQPYYRRYEKRKRPK